MTKEEMDPPIEPAPGLDSGPVGDERKGWKDDEREAAGDDEGV